MLDTWFDGCGCWTCTDSRVQARADLTGSFAMRFAMPMCVCSECGNKRCPKATHHDFPCSWSNDLGQVGSRYA